MTSTEAPVAGQRGIPPLVVVLVAALASAAGATAAILVLGERVSSRAEVVANAAAPPPAVVTVAAERRVVRGGVGFRATPDESAASVLTAPPGVTGVVTRVGLRPGTSLTAGTAAVEVQGQPLFVLPGAFPFYRDIRPGDAGPDVAQLQEGLRSAGFAIRGEAGTFGPRTQDAFRALYRRAGYEARVDAEAGGVVARMRELWVVAALPQRLTTVGVRVGTVLNSDTPLGTAAGPARLRGALPAGASVESGETAEVLDDLTGAKWRARVVEVRAAEGDDGNVVVVEVGAGQPATRAGQSYRVTVAGRSSAGSVVAVPVTAVQQRADGSHFVSVVSGATPPADVPVRVGVVGGGWVEIAGDVEPGARVVVGAATGGDE